MLRGCQGGERDADKVDEAFRGSKQTQKFLISLKLLFSGFRILERDRSLGGF